MKRISEVAAYVFFVSAALGVIVHFDINPFAHKLMKQHTEYDATEVSTYSRADVQSIIQGNDELAIESLEGLVRHQASANAMVASASKPKRGDPQQILCTDCKEAVSFLKTERDERIKAEDHNKLLSRLTFFSTLVVGLMIYALKHNGWGRKIISTDNTRESFIGFVEFIFAAWIVGIGIIF